MSCYIVNNQTIINIVSFIEGQFTKAESYNKIDVSLKGYDFSKDGEFEKLTKDMWRLNIRSYNGIYAETVKLKDVYCGYSYTPQGGAMQVLKSLHCWQYQSCECNCDNSRLYKELEKLEAKIAIKLAMSSKRYNDCEWG